MPVVASHTKTWFTSAVNSTLRPSAEIPRARPLPMRDAVPVEESHTNTDEPADV